MPLRVRLKGGAVSRLNVKREWSSSGFSNGNKSNRRDDLKEKVVRFADGNKRKKREENKGSQRNAGQRSNQSNVVHQMDRKKNALGYARRKREADEDSQDYDTKNPSFSKAKVFRKSPSPMEGKLAHGKVSARKGDKLKPTSLDDDDLRLGQSMLNKNMKVSRGKKFEQSAKVSKQKGCSTNSDLEEHVGESKKSDNSGQITEKQPCVHRTRVLDNSGKKIRISKKDLVSDSEATPKKRKRMKLDRYDMSNKRLDDFTPHMDEKTPEKILEKNPSEETEMSINSRFRAIQPSSSILSFVEDNLLGRRRINEIKNAGYNVKLSAPLDNVPFSTSTERERIEENVFRNKLEFFAAAKVSSSFPPTTTPEVAFAGVSNVGKSSLLNALTRQWGIVRTSDKPGLTQTVNFFQLASKLCLVDLPGYGFAYAKDEVRESWQELVKKYVSSRVGLRRVCLLVHTKRGMKPLDFELVDIMERSRTPYQIVLTKTDLVFPIDVARRAMEIQESLRSKKSAVNPVMMVSSKTGAGMRNLRTVLGKLARFVKP